MGLMSPAYNTIRTSGRSKSKKFKSSDAKRKAAELDREWENLLRKYPPMNVKSATNKSQTVSQKTSSKTQAISSTKPGSLNEWITGPVSSKPTQHYTGSKIVGIGTLHKSNAVPIFTNEEAQDIAKMRR